MWLVLTLWDITADGKWASLSLIRPDIMLPQPQQIFMNMEKIFGFKQSWVRFGTPVCVALVAGVLLFAGCGKKPPVGEVPTQPAAQNTNPAASPIYTRPATPTIVAGDPGAEPDLKQMTRSLRGWIARTHIVPKNFEDYMAQANIQFPPAPAGKKYVIGKRMTVELANR